MDLVQRLDNLESPSQFYGRAVELEELGNYFGDNSSVFLIQGNPGIGKTTLTREAIAKKSKDPYHLEIEMEKSDALFPNRVFADIVMDLLGNPESYDEFKKGLNGWCGSERDEDSLDLLTSAVWTYRPFEDYESTHTPEMQESGFGDALVSFFSSYNGDQKRIIQVSNYERRWLGEDPKTDEIFRKIDQGVEGDKIKFVVETRDNIQICQNGLGLRGVNEFPIEERCMQTSIESSEGTTEKIRNQTGMHPYALELYFSNYDLMREIGDGAPLEDILNIAVDQVEEGQLSLLQFIAHSQKPVTSRQVVSSSEILKFGNELVENMQELIDRNLVVKTANGFVVRNPRLGEYVVSNRTEDEHAKDIHKVHGGMSSNPSIGFYHGIESESVPLTYQNGIRLLGRGAVAEDLAIVTAARKVIDKAISEDPNDEIVEMGLDLGHKSYQRQLRLGNWAQWESMGDIRLRRQRMKDDNPMNEWREMSWGYISSIADLRWDDASEYLDRLVAVGQADKKMMPAANHLGTILLQERARFDDSLDNEQRVSFLREVVDRMGNQLSSDSNLGHTDGNHFAFSASLLSLYGVGDRTDLLRGAESRIVNAVNDTPNSWQLAEFLGTLAQVQLAYGKINEASDTLGRADTMFTKYGDNSRVRCDDIVTKMGVAQLRGENGEVAMLRGDLRNRLKRTSPKDFFDYPNFAERQLELLTA